VNESSKPSNSNQEQSRQKLKRWGFRLLLLLALAVIIVLGVAGIALQDITQPTPIDPTVLALATSLLHSATPSLNPSETAQLETASPLPLRDPIEGTLFYSARPDGYSHLFAYGTGESVPVQLTFGNWDDRDPAIHPDGNSIAFSSNRDGYWDLYMLDLSTGEVRQLTQTPGYEGHPTWSPDGRWVAYEAHDGDNFDVWILPMDPGQTVFQLTNNLASDTSPAWDPNGRRIAFVSNREGSRDIYLAHLDRPDDRFINVTSSSGKDERDPAFNPEGTMLSFTLDDAPFPRLFVMALDDVTGRSGEIGQGSRATWSPDGRLLVGILGSPNSAHIVTYAIGDGIGQEIGLPLHRNVERMDWHSLTLPGEAITRAGAQGDATPLYVVNTDESSGSVDRMQLARLAGISAPNPLMADAADEAYMALRERAGLELGWDFLGQLENAFVGINDPLPPAIPHDDWLYTGRAFSFKRDAVSAGWIEFVKEEFGGETYWRVYVRTVDQDGSHGEPLRVLPWNFDARFDGDPNNYDQGGALKDRIPAGYYVDFTQLALVYGFERVPSLLNWRTYYDGARYNEFVFRDGLSWLDAMLELYPASAIVTPTVFMTPTPTPTRTPRPTPTPWWWHWQTPVTSP